MTCVTPDLQVVYAGAFITRVGAASRQAAENRVGLYTKVIGLNNDYQQQQANFQDT